MMSVMFWDEFCNLVARITVVANTGEEAVAIASAKYNTLPNAEFKPLCTIATITTESL